MSQSGHRHRAVSLAIGLIVGVPLLAAAGPAGADPGGAPGGTGLAAAEPMESGRQVTFRGGGLLSLSCAANPDSGSVTIEAETTLRVVNDTGHRATLLLDGSARGEIARGSTAEVLFHRGPVSLALKPHCVLPQQRSVRVRVVAARPDAGTPDAPSHPSGRPGGGSRPGDQAPDGDSGLGRATPRAGGPARDEGPREAPEDRVRRTAAPTSPADGGDGPEPRATGLPGADGSVDGVPPAPDLTPVDDAATAPVGEDWAAEPMASVEPITDKGPTGLLAIIAIVCVFGALAGAIRAILAQRTQRAKAA